MRALGTMSTSGSSGPVSPTVAPYSPSTDYTSDDLRPAKITPWLRPELCNSPVLQVAPRQSVPSYWRAPPFWCAAFARLLHDGATADDEEAPERPRSRPLPRAAT